MTQSTLDMDNPYHDAWLYQIDMINCQERISKETEKLKEAQEKYAEAIARGEETGKATIGGYSLKVETTTKEKRTIEMDLIKTHCPEIITSNGTLKADFATKFIPAYMLNQMLNAHDFDKCYKLGLGELDKALGGKKNSAQYVTVEITPTETKTITRLPIAPIVEV